LRYEIIITVITNFSVEVSVLGRKKQAPIDKIETVIGFNTNFKGRLVCDGSVRIDGICEEGVIETLGNIVVGPQAKVAADLIAQNVSVSGAVTGNIKTTGRLEILSTGKVWGDVDTGSFLLDNEAHFQGKLLIQGEIPPPEFGTDAAKAEAAPAAKPEDEPPA
jgi:cytoskeletal protein CcmA (bactofilin family)